MAAAKRQTKKDLENKIAELEARIDQITSQILSEKPEVKDTLPKSTKPAEKAKGTLPKGFEKPAEVKPVVKDTLPKSTKPAETKVKDAKPAEKAKGTLPKGFEKPAETKAEKVTTAEETVQPPATIQDALESAYNSAPQTDFHQYRAKVTGYSPAPNRYFVRRTAPVGKVPTTNWNEQKSKVTGYTQPSNQYFATRPRLAYHPADKMFGGFSGTSLSVEVQVQVPEPPKRGTLPKGF